MGWGTLKFFFFFWGGGGQGVYLVDVCSPCPWAFRGLGRRDYAVLGLMELVQSGLGIWGSIGGLGSGLMKLEVHAFWVQGLGFREGFGRCV